MFGILLTQNNTFIIGPVSQVLGIVMDGIYNFLNFFGIQNLGLCIILFTILMYLFMMPLTIKQQKFSKLSAKMNPELQVIQKKYKDKKDQDSITRMNEETKAVYAKYGTSPTGGCLQLVIQMPILFALYRVIWNIPAYVPSVKNVYIPLVEKILNSKGGQAVMEEIGKGKSISPDKYDFALNNTIIDVLYKFQTSDWNSLATKFPDLKDLITTTESSISRMNNFMGLNIGDAPLTIIKTAFTTGSFLLIIGALAIPLLSALTQWFNTKLMPQQTVSDENNAMASSMKTMNLMMPIMSAFFCFTLPSGLGLYWIAGAVVRSIQQIAINKYIDKEDIDAIVKKNMEKAAKKAEKKGLPSNTVSNAAKVNTKTIETNNKVTKNNKEENEKAIAKATEYYNKNAKPGSLASKANMVKQYNEKNNK